MQPLQNLNLPSIDLPITSMEGKIYIFDPFRKKKIVLTPEEWVRQHFASYLVNQLQYPKSLMAIESGLKYNQRQKRSDILIYDKNGLPNILVECKSFHIKLSQSTLNQASIYNQIVKAPWLAITNGLHHIYFNINFAESKFTQHETLPQYEVSPPK